ncbi:putative transcription factor bHLH family [Helianthus anomalus]
MLAISSPLFSTIYGWPSENLTPQNLQQDCNNISMEFEANSYDPLLDFHTYNQMQQEIAPENSVSISSERVVSENIDEPYVKVVKKLNHNASERERRKRVNDLYAFLHSLLPKSTNQKKKVSIPQTVSRAMRYIPELQKEVEALICKKEKLSSSSSTIANTKKDYLRIKKQTAEGAIIDITSSVISSVRVLGVKEAVVQLIYSTEHMSKNKDISFLSKVVEFFEHEEDVVLLNSTTFIGSGEGMSLSTLHLQAQGDTKLEAERLEVMLRSFHQQ